MIATRGRLRKLLRSVLLFVQGDHDESAVCWPHPSTRPLRALGRRLHRTALAETDGERPLARVDWRTPTRSAALAAFRFTFWMNCARHLREGVTAAGELRRADRALTCAAGALLAPRLRRGRRRRARGSSSRRCPRGARSARRARPRARGAASPRRRTRPPRARPPSTSCLLHRAGVRSGAAISRAPPRGRSSGRARRP